MATRAAQVIGRALSENFLLVVCDEVRPKFVRFCVAPLTSRPECGSLFAERRRSRCVVPAFGQQSIRLCASASIRGTGVSVRAPGGRAAHARRRCPAVARSGPAGRSDHGEGSLSNSPDGRRRTPLHPRRRPAERDSWGAVLLRVAADTGHQRRGSEIDAGLQPAGMGSEPVGKYAQIERAEIGPEFVVGEHRVHADLPLRVIALWRATISKLDSAWHRSRDMTSGCRSTRTRTLGGSGVVAVRATAPRRVPSAPGADRCWPGGSSRARR